MEDEDESKVLHHCEVFVHLVLLFVIDHIKNHRVNYFSVLLYYRFSLELLKGGPQKM